MSQTLADLLEDELLPRLWAHLPVGGPGVVTGPGDDAAVLEAGRRRVVTTDTMVRGADWLDAWSTGWQVGAKVVAQNLADVTAMGGVCDALVLTLAADPATSVGWVEELARGVGERSREAGIAVVGGDLSSAPAGVVMVSVTALGWLEGEPVLRSGARPGDVLAVSGALGRAALGLELLRAGRTAAPPGTPAAVCLDHQRSPRADAAAGVLAREAGATAMLDVSDGLARDGERIARASGVDLVLEPAAVRAQVVAWEEVLGREAARRAVLTGGEEHCLLATFGARDAVPPGWQVLGTAEAADGAPSIRLEGRPLVGGWDHFRPGA